MSVSGLQKSKVSMSNSNDPADPLADLFGFETAQKRPQEEQNQNISAHVELGFKPWRVFVNNIDSYHGRRIVEVQLWNFLKIKKNLTALKKSPQMLKYPCIYG